MKRTVQVGMPQMALGYLSENWLLKELGDLHWDKLCSSLQRKSNDLVDSQGRDSMRRLFVYASSSMVR
jgi:probable biosynthetic protein (TIGR04098 family)